MSYRAEVDRHLGQHCHCALLDCCHTEGTDAAGDCRDRGPHVHWGNPATGYLYPWEPGDESWRDILAVPPAARLPRRTPNRERAGRGIARLAPSGPAATAERVAPCSPVTE